MAPPAENTGQEDQAVNPAEADQNAENQAEGKDDLSFVYDVPVKLHVELGEVVLTVGDVLKCGKGSVIPLNQKVGDPFKILLEKRALAEGEIVEAGENLAIKITNVLKN